jgi:phytoene synthase
MGPHVTHSAGAGPAAGRTSFAYSFPFLDPPRRKALATVYAFCRATDDIVDGPGSEHEKSSRLGRWQEELARALGEGGVGSATPLLNDLAGVSRNFGIPRELFHDLVRGVGMDITAARYDTFASLREYCRLVASTVGLMCLDIFGRRNARTEEYAGTLGIALQLTNIIRDVGADARMGRIYIPIEDLRRFGCTEEDILARHRPDRFSLLMEFQAARAEEFYAKAGTLLAKEDMAAMRPARIMEEIYHRHLRKIRASGYDVLDRAVAISRPAQLAVAFRYGVIARMFGR